MVIDVRLYRNVFSHLTDFFFYVHEKQMKNDVSESSAEEDRE